MKKFIQVRKKDNRVCCVSDGSNQYDKSLFDEIEVTLTKEKLDNLKGPYTTYYKENKLDFIQSGTVVRKEKLKEVMDKVSNATNVNTLKTEVIKLINLIK